MAPSWCRATIVVVSLVSAAASGLPLRIAAAEPDRPQWLIGYNEHRTNLPGGRHANVSTNRGMLVRADGTGRRPLAAELAAEPGSWTQFAGWSPDGSQAILVRGWESEENARWEEEHKAFRFTADGWLVDSLLVDVASGKAENVTAVDRVSTYNTGLFFWPNDPRRLGFTALIDGRSHPFSMDRDGHHKTNLTQESRGFAYGFSSSPDGSRISYHDNYQVYLADADGSARTLVKTGHPFMFCPSWSPDGTTVLFLSGEQFDCHPHIVRADGTGLRKLADRGGYRGTTEFLDVPDYHGGSSDIPVWAADGQSVFYTAKVGDNVELFRVAVDGEPEQLTKTADGSLHYHPKPSPDGRWIVYGSNRGGLRNLFLMRLSDRKEYPLTDLPAGHAAMHAFWQPPVHRIDVEITSPLAAGHVPVDPVIDCGQAIREQGGSGVLDPNSLEVVNLVTGEPVPFGRTEDFAYGDRGRLEWVVTDPAHTKFEVRFRTAAARPAVEPQRFTPMVGVGDLLRYNAASPRPFALPYPARLVDLTGDGKADLVGCWNYAYRPGWPWDGVVCYPRVGESAAFLFGNLTRIRHTSRADSNDHEHFINIYQWSDFADFDGDGLVDIVWCPANGDRFAFFRNTGGRDAGGMPVFVDAGSVPKHPDLWQSCRAVDLDADGAVDVVIGDVWFRNTKAGSMPPVLEAPQPLEILPGGGHQSVCWHDVDLDGRLDAVLLEPVAGQGICDFRIVWRRRTDATPPRFAPAVPLAGLPSAQTADAAGELTRPYYVTSVADGQRSGLLVTTLPNLTAVLYEQKGPERFVKMATARSQSAVMSLSDQAWPCLCDWDDDGDLDLLVGGGYGSLQIVINEGSAARPAWSEPRPVLAEDKPIRLTRDDILGGKHDHHDMGYPYPASVDWDADGLPDLVVPNETNRIFWFRNVGTRQSPKFGGRQQLLCDGHPDSPEARLLSARRSGEDGATEHASGKRYPAEAGQPFFWRTGAAFADFNGDGLIDMVTHAGGERVATLFLRVRDADGGLRLRRQGPLETADGKPITAYGRPGHSTDAFRAVDWDGDGLTDLIHSSAGTWTGGGGRYTHAGVPGGSSIQLRRNVGTAAEPKFAPPRPLRMYGEPIAMTHHGPHPWAGDLDGDGLPDLVACVEWAVYPFYAHNAIEMPARPTIRVTVRK